MLQPPPDAAFFIGEGGTSSSSMMSSSPGLGALALAGLPSIDAPSRISSLSPDAALAVPGRSHSPSALQNADDEQLSTIWKGLSQSTSLEPQLQSHPSRSPYHSRGQIQSAGTSTKAGQSLVQS